MDQQTEGAGALVSRHQPPRQAPHGRHQEADAAPPARIQDRAQQDSGRHKRDVRNEEL